MTDHTQSEKMQYADCMVDSVPCSSNVLGLLLTMREIQKQPRKKDPRILMIDENGKCYY
jgi:hypothetical protein